MKTRDTYFFQLIDLAKEGDEASADILFKSYDFDFHREGDPRDQLPTRKNQEPKQTQEK